MSARASAEEEALALRLYQSGLAGAEVADGVGRSRSWVYKLLKREGVLEPVAQRGCRGLWKATPSSPLAPTDRAALASAGVALRHIDRLDERPGALETPCWLWVGGLDGTGHAASDGRGVHRMIFEAVYGPVDDGLVLDHLCWRPGESEHRRCCRPDHLEAVTQRTNTNRARPEGSSRFMGVRRLSGGKWLTTVTFYSSSEEEAAQKYDAVLRAVDPRSETNGEVRA